MRAYTDLEQSKKLAEILLPESADMVWDLIIPDLPTIRVISYEDFDYNNKHLNIITAWSLAALLAILPNEIITDNRFECHYQVDIRKYNGGDNTTLYQIAYGNSRGSSGSWHDMINTGEKENLVDCCVQMIIELKKMNLI